MRLTHLQWKDIRERVCAGDNIPDVARDYGVTPPAIYVRRKNESWVMLGEHKREFVALERTPGDIASPNNISLAKEVNTPTDRETAGDQTVTTLARKLYEAAQTSPEQFQETLAGHLEALLAEGLPEIPPPRTISEAAKLVGLIRQTRGLDAKSATPGGLFDPVRPLRRATGNIVIEEGFEP